VTPTEKQTSSAITLAEKTYSKHTITDETVDRWRLSAPDTFGFWAEVVVLSNGTLLVHGDTDPVLFGPMIDCRRPENAVHWMARSSPDDSYFIGKASRAMGAAAAATIWRPSIDAFAENLEVFIEDMDEEDDRGPLEDMLYEARRSEDSDVEGLQRAFTDATDADYEPRGHVISSTMIFAWAIIQRLSSLLKAREPKEESEECP